MPFDAARCQCWSVPLSKRVKTNCMLYLYLHHLTQIGFRQRNGPALASRGIVRHRTASDSIAQHRTAQRLCTCSLINMWSEAFFFTGHGLYTMGMFRYGIAKFGDLLSKLVAVCDGRSTLEDRSVRDFPQMHRPGPFLHMCVLRVLCVLTYLPVLPVARRNKSKVGSLLNL